MRRLDGLAFAVELVIFHLLEGKELRSEDCLCELLMSVQESLVQLVASMRDLVMVDARIMNIIVVVIIMVVVAPVPGFLPSGLSSSVTH